MVACNHNMTDICENKMAKIVDDVNYIKQKINNGLTERSKQNTEQLNELAKNQAEVDKKLDVHLMNYTIFVAHSKTAHEELRTTMDGLIKSQGTMNKVLITGVSSFIGSVGIFCSWLLANADTIAAVFTALAKAQ